MSSDEQVRAGEEADWLWGVIVRAKRAAETGPRAMLNGSVRHGDKQ